MPLETATYVSDLNVANPAHTDGLSQADSHARLIKATIKATFSNFTSAALTSTQAQLDAAATAVANGISSLASSGAHFSANPTDLFFNGTPGIIQVNLQGTQAAQFIRSGGVNSLNVNGNLAASLNVSGASFSGGSGQLVPIGAVLEWYDDVLPTEGGYAWANGQIIASANTVCPVLLARWGARFGGNGATTMGVPDRRDTVGVGKSTMGGVASRGLQTLTNTVLGTLFGLANTTLITANLPAYTPSGTITGNASIQQDIYNGTAFGSAASGFVLLTGPSGTGNFGTHFVNQPVTGTLNGNAQGGTSNSFNNVQPSTTCNYILRLG